MTSPLDAIDWYRFLARPRLSAPAPNIISAIINQPILITGAGGSIGTALAHRLAGEGAQLILLESSENNLYELQSYFADLPYPSRPAFYLGSVADHSLLDDIFALHRPRLIFHAAAYKHVPLLEDQPFAAIENNVFATETLVATAAANQARIVLLSTDKAVAPASIMGATKRVAEQIVLGSLLASQGTVLRLGNVLGSRGSVSEVFVRQLAGRHSLTVTDPAARRYFLTIDEAVDLLISAAAAEPLALLVPDLTDPHFIADLARFIGRSIAPGHETPVEFTQLRAGDKESEQLWGANETSRALNSGSLLFIDSPKVQRAVLQSALDNLRSATKARDLSAALAALRIVVPDYSPSRTVLASRSTTAIQVSDD